MNRLQTALNRLETAVARLDAAAATSALRNSAEAGSDGEREALARELTAVLERERSARETLATVTRRLDGTIGRLRAVIAE